MKKIIIVIVILLIIGLGIYYFTPGASPDKTVNKPEPVVSLATTVNIKNFSFNPAILNVKTGTQVTWVNNDVVAHTVASDSGNLLNSPTLSPGQSFSFTFTNPGSVSYHCNIHPMMKGQVVVEN